MNVQHPVKAKGFLSPSAGHTLLELMVAIIVGLLLVLGAFGVLAAFEGNKRTTTALNDALQSGNFGLFAMDKLIRSAGSGFARNAAISSYGCGLNFTSVDPVTSLPSTTVTSGGIPTLPAPFSTTLSSAGVTTLRLAPAIIFPAATTVDGAPNTSDVVMLMLGGGGYGEVPIPITGSNGPTVESTIGFVPGEWVLVTNSSGVGDCMITRVGPSFAGSSADNLFLPLTDAAVGSAANLLAVNSHVVALGKGPSANFTMYGVGKRTSADNNALQSLDLLNSKYDTAESVGDDIVMMRAVYEVQPVSTDPLTWTNPAKDVSINGNVYSYAPADLMSGLPAADKAIKSIRAIRLAMIVRAPINEKNTTNLLQKSNGASLAIFDSLATAPQANAVAFSWSVPDGNFRYRVLEVTIPIRNELL